MTVNKDTKLYRGSDGSLWVQTGWFEEPTAVIQNILAPDQKIIVPVSSEASLKLTPMTPEDQVPDHVEKKLNEQEEELNELRRQLVATQGKLNVAETQLIGRAEDRKSPEAD